MRKHIQTSVRLLVIPIMIGLISGCGAELGNAESMKLKASDIRPALNTIPYRYSLRRVTPPVGDMAGFQGKTYGPHKTRLHFSIGLGDRPVAVPIKGSGTVHAVWATPFGFALNDDLVAMGKSATRAQWEIAAKMAVAVYESLCRAASGEPCPV